MKTSLGLKVSVILEVTAVDKIDLFDMEWLKKVDTAVEELKKDSPIVERKSFMVRAIAGEIEDLDKAILDEVDAWHEYQPTIPEDVIGENVMTWLGMSWSEYSRWVKHPKELVEIVEARRNG